MTEEDSRAAQKLRRAQLADMDDSTLLAECERRGWTVYWDRPSGRMRIGSADDDLPFDGSARRE